MALRHVHAIRVHAVQSEGVSSRVIDKELIGNVSKVCRSERGKGCACHFSEQRKWGGEMREGDAIRGTKPVRLREQAAKKRAQRELVLAVSLLAALTLGAGLFLWFLGVIGSGVWRNVGASRVLFLENGETLPSQNGMLAVAFYSESCPHCTRMRGPFLRVSAMPEFADIKFAAVNVYENKKLTENFEITFIPNVLFFAEGINEKGQGKFVRYEGSPSRKSLERFLRKQVP